MELKDINPHEPIMFDNRIKKNSVEINQKYTALARETDKAVGLWAEFKDDYNILCNYWNQHYKALTHYVVSRKGNMEIAYTLSGLKAAMDNCAQNLRYHEGVVIVNMRKIEVYMQSCDTLKFYYAWNAIYLTWHHLSAAIDVCMEFERMYAEFQQITESFPYL